MKLVWIIKATRLLKIFGSVGMAHLGFILLTADKDNKEIINHELIHIAQQRETLILLWYLIYIGHFIINFFKTKFKFWDAYRIIIFEIEAFKYEKDYNYLDNRKFFNWLLLAQFYG